MNRAVMAITRLRADENPVSAVSHFLLQARLCAHALQFKNPIVKGVEGASKRNGISLTSLTELTTRRCRLSGNVVSKNFGSLLQIQKTGVIRGLLTRDCTSFTRGLF